MKKLAQIAAAAALAIGLLGGVAAADTTCNGSISNTGTGITNTVTCVDNNNNTVTCDNNVVVVDNNDQSANSGNSDTSGNTSGGNAQSGDASNTNTTTVTVGAACTPVGSNGDFVVNTPPPTPAPSAASSTPQVLSEQVANKPVGGVGAGAGAGVTKNTTGLIAATGVSLAALGAGLALRKRLQA